MLHWKNSLHRLTSKVEFHMYASLRLVWKSLKYWYIHHLLSTVILLSSQTFIYCQLVFMVNFKCLECNIFYPFSSTDGHHRLMHQSTFQIRIISVKLLLIDRLTINFFTPLIIAQIYVGAMITSNPISKCNIWNKKIQP